MGEVEDQYLVCAKDSNGTWFRIWYYEKALALQCGDILHKAEKASTVIVSVFCPEDQVHAKWRVLKVFGEPDEIRYQHED